MTDAASVTSLTAYKAQPNEKVVRVMRHWLSMARSGELQSVILLGILPSGAHARAASGGMRDADAVYLATLVIHDGIIDGMARETSTDTEDLAVDEDDGDD